ncbi:MAG: amino acid adenylation domain-containing protein, partial [Actinomycetota bacterium]
MRTAPLTPAQLRIWMSERRADIGAAYVLDASIRMEGPLEADSLQRALDRLVEQHPMLGARFGVGEDGRPVQWVAPTSIPLRIVAPDPDAMGDAERAIARAQVELGAFDVTGEAPLVRATLVPVAEEDHVLVLAYHHLLGDGASSRVLRRDLMRHYAAALGHEVAEPRQSVDYLAHADLARGSEPGDLGRALERLAGLPASSTIRPQSIPDAVPGETHWMELPLDDDLARRVTTFSRRHRLSPFIVYSAAVHLTVQRYLSQSDTAIGFMTSGRSARERDTVGLFAKTLVQRLTTDDRSTVADVLGAIRDDVLRATEADAVELEDLARELGQGGAVDAHPVFQVMINSVELGETHAVGPLTARPMILPAPVSWLDLEFRLHPGPGGTMEAYLRCPASRYTMRRLEGIADAFRTHLIAILADPDAAVRSIPLLDEPGRSAAIAASTGPRRPLGASIPARIRAQVEAMPDHQAVRFGAASLTYGQLGGRAEAVAASLGARGVGRGDIVGVCADRSIDLVVALVGVMLSGAAYLPLETRQPRDRRDAILDDIEPALVVVGDSVAASWADAPVERIGVDALVAATDRDRDAAPAPEVVLDDPAYVILTSGSTGLPKAVANSHRGLANRLDWMQHEFALDDRDTVLQKTPYTFDVSVWEFFWPFTAGATLVVAEPDGHRDAHYLADLIVDEGVSIVHFVPSMLRGFVDAGKAAALDAVRATICSGEALPSDLVGDVLTWSETALYNLYGPTEAAIDVTMTRCTLDDARAPSVSIGAVVPNTSVLVLDERGAPVPFGALGELYIGGDQVALGYLNAPDENRRRFVADPVGGGRAFRTGDLGCLNEDGSIQFLGRIDRQVKVNGFRVEPGEIEAAIMTLPTIGRATVLTASSAHGSSALVAFFTAETAVTARAVTAHLAGVLPEHLIPVRCHQVDEFPLNPSGKVDAGALVALDRAEQGRSSPRSTSGPLTPLESEILEAMRAALDHPAIEAYDSFFAVGGDSIRSLEFAAR